MMLFLLSKTTTDTMKIPTRSFFTTFPKILFYCANLSKYILAFPNPLTSNIYNLKVAASKDSRLLGYFARTLAGLK